MSSQNLNNRFKGAVQQIDQIIDAVEKRGYDDVSEEYDDYAFLITSSYEFRKLIIFELYEAYFPPKRHEHELQILTNLVETVAKSHSVSFVANAAITGVIGSVVYDFLKNAINHILQRFHVKRSRLDAFQNIEDVLEQIHKYFDSHDKALTEQICSALKLESYKIEPLLKLLGFRCKRKGKQQVWIRPSKW